MKFHLEMSHHGSNASFSFEAPDLATARTFAQAQADLLGSQGDVGSPRWALSILPSPADTGGVKREFFTPAGAGTVTFR